jgi:hypothetical protein
MRQDPLAEPGSLKATAVRCPLKHRTETQAVRYIPQLLLRAAGTAAAWGYAAAYLGVAIIGIAGLFLTLQSRVSRDRPTPEGGS